MLGNAYQERARGQACSADSSRWLPAQVGICFEAGSESEARVLQHIGLSSSGKLQGGAAGLALIQVRSRVRGGVPAWGCWRAEAAQLAAHAWQQHNTSVAVAPSLCRSPRSCSARGRCCNACSACLQCRWPQSWCTAPWSRSAPATCPTRRSSRCAAGPADRSSWTCYGARAPSAALCVTAPPTLTPLPSPSQELGSLGSNWDASQRDALQQALSRRVALIQVCPCAGGARPLGLTASLAESCGTPCGCISSRLVDHLKNPCRDRLVPAKPSSAFTCWTPSCAGDGAGGCLLGLWAARRCMRLGHWAEARH
jgi:hypothetical protein